MSSDLLDPVAACASDDTTTALEAASDTSDTAIDTALGDCTEEQRARFIKILQGVLFVDLLGVALVLPMMYQYATALGADAKAYGWIGFIYSAAQLAGSPFMGWVINNYGSRTALVVNYTGAAVSYIGAAFAPSFLFLCLMRIPVGLVKKSMTISYTFAAKLTHGSKRSIAMGEMKSIVSLAFVVGPLMGGYLAEFDTRLPAVVSATLYAVASGVVLTSLPSLPIHNTPHPAGEVHSAKPKPKPIWRKVFFPSSSGAKPSEGESDGGGSGAEEAAATLSLLRVLLVAGLFMELAEKLNRGALPIIIKDGLHMGATSTGLMWSLNAGANTLTGGVGMRFLKKVSDDHQIVSRAIVVAAVSLPVWCAFPSFASFVSMFLCYVSAAFVAETCLMSILTHEVPHDQVPSVLFTVETMNSILGLIAPIASGYLSAASPYYTALVGTACYVMAGLVITRLPASPLHQKQE